MWRPPLWRFAARYSSGACRQFAVTAPAVIALGLAAPQLKTARWHDARHHLATLRTA
jgi:hypothetical protein